MTCPHVAQPPAVTPCSRAAVLVHGLGSLGLAGAWCSEIGGAGWGARQGCRRWKPAATWVAFWLCSLLSARVLLVVLTGSEETHRSILGGLVTVIERTPFRLCAVWRKCCYGWAGCDGPTRSERLGFSRREPGDFGFQRLLDGDGSHGCCWLRGIKGRQSSAGATIGLQIQQMCCLMTVVGVI